MKRPLRIFLRVLKWGAVCVLLVVLGVAVYLGDQYSRYQSRAAKFNLDRLSQFSQRSAVFDVNGELYSYFGGENRLVVSLGRVPKSFINALLAREDSRYWQHNGVDYHGIARAAWTNFRSGEVRQGASTITQQLARNSYDLSGRTIDRKILEALLARRIERRFSKEQVLEFYVNRIYFGSGFWGIEAAARGYFGKPAEELTLGESALLAGLIRSPNRFSPLRDHTGSLNERDTVLGRMVELQMITREEAAAAENAPIVTTRRRAMRFAEDQVMDAVTRELEWVVAPSFVEFGGLRVFTTIDPHLQRIAEGAADRQLTKIEEVKGYPHPRKADFESETSEDGVEKPTDYLQAALVAIDNRTGAIRAIVGSRDYSQSKYPRALLAKRQIGSTFKPFIYGAAFQRGLLPGTLVDDSRIGPGELRNSPKVRGKEWSPENSDGKYAGLQQASWGLAKSRNTMTVRIGEYVGLQGIRDVAGRAGIGERIPDYPVAYLGAFETTLRELTAAYTIFPNHGVQHPAYLIARVEDDTGRILFQAEHTERRVLNPDAAWMVSSTLQEAMKTGTAAKAESLGWKKPGAGKTGTTNDFHDAWFVGYTTSLTCGVWVGMDKPETIMEKGYGSALALPIWVDFMQSVPENGYPAAPFRPLTPLAKARMCSASGARATSRCEQHGLAYEATLPAARIPGSTCQVHPEFVPVYASNPQQPGAAQPLQRYPQNGAIASQQSGGFVGSLPPQEDVQIADSLLNTAAAEIAPAASRDASRLPPARPIAPPPRIERTESGVRIYNSETPAAEPRPPSSSPPAATPMPVMRAIPVQQSGRATEAEPPRRVRVERAQPVVRSAAPARPVFRGRPVDEEEEF